MRAELCARAGVEDAVHRITSAMDRSLIVDPATTYWGNNRTETGSPDGGEVGFSGVIVSEGEGFRYRLRVRMPAASVDSVLLGSPAIDDVTIYLSRDAEYLSYEVLNTSL